MAMISEILRIARNNTLKREAKIKSLRPGAKHNEADEVTKMVDDAMDSFYDDTELDRLQERPEYEDWKRDQDERIEREIFGAKR